MQMALRRVRVDADKERKKMGENARLYTDAVNEIYNALEARLKPVEDRMFSIAKAEELAIKERAAKLKEARIAELTPFAAVTATDISFYSLSDMPEGQYQALLASIRTAAETRIAEIKQAEEARIAAEAARVQREKDLAIENLRLAAESAAREKALEEERKKAAVEVERVRKENETKLVAERKKSADEAARIRKIADEKAAKERAEREAHEKKLVEERKTHDALVAKQRAELEAKAEAARKEAQKLAEAEAVRKAQEAKEKSDQEEKARKAASAPDRDKVLAFAKAIQSVTPPILTTSPALSKLIAEQSAKFVKWLEGEARKL